MVWRHRRMVVVLAMLAWFTAPLETQGRGSMHPHILVTLLGHDLTHWLASLRFWTRSHQNATLVQKKIFQVYR